MHTVTINSSDGLPCWEWGGSPQDAGRKGGMDVKREKYEGERKVGKRKKKKDNRKKEHRS